MKGGAEGEAPARTRAARWGEAVHQHAGARGTAASRSWDAGKAVAALYPAMISWELGVV